MYRCLGASARLAAAGASTTVSAPFDASTLRMIASASGNTRESEKARTNLRGVCFVGAFGAVALVLGARAPGAFGAAGAID